MIEAKPNPNFNPQQETDVLNALRNIMDSGQAGQATLPVETLAQVDTIVSEMIINHDLAQSVYNYLDELGTEEARQMKSQLEQGFARQSGSLNADTTTSTIS